LWHNDTFIRLCGTASGTEEMNIMKVAASAGSSNTLVQAVQAAGRMIREIPIPWFRMPRY